MYWAACGSPGSTVCSTGVLLQLPLDGGSPIALVGASVYTQTLAVDATSVYFINAAGVAPGNSVMRAPIGGGAAVALGTGPDPSSVAVDGTYVYWGGGVPDTSGAIMRVPVGGGTAVALAAFPCYPTDLALDATNVYWTCFGPKPSALLMSVAKAGGIPTTIASSTAPLSLAVDATSIYWVGGGSVMKAAKCGGTPVALTTPVQGQYPIGLTLDSTSLYWTLTGTNPYNTAYGVQSLPLAGGSVTTLVSNQADPMGIVVDQDSVYWTDFGLYGVFATSGSVMKLSPK